MPTDLRVGQTHAIGVASTEPLSTTRPALGQVALRCIKYVSTLLCSLDGSSSFRGSGVHIPASQPQSASLDPVPGGRCNAKAILILGSGYQISAEGLS